MKDINDILISYFTANLKMKEMMNHDWSKFDILYDNNKDFKDICNTIVGYLDDFHEAISLKNIHTSDPSLEKLYIIMSNVAGKKEYTSVTYSLERAIDILGDERLFYNDTDTVNALKELMKLPNFEPDSWVERKYMSKGIHLHNPNSKIPNYIIKRYEEVCNSFVYGNFFAVSALARSTIELVLRDKYPNLKGRSLDEIINKDWNKIKGLKERGDIQKMMDGIRREGNYIMHDPGDRLAAIINKVTALTSIKHLIEIIEYMYN